MDWRFRLRWIVWYRITAPFKAVGNLFARIFTIYRVAFLLAVIAILLWFFNKISLQALLPDIITDLLSVALAIFIIDRAYRIRSDAERKRILITQLGSKNNAVASAALHELEAQGWLSDGSLQHASLMACNLDGNSFAGADLKFVSFSFASLRDTTWFEADLQDAFLDHADLSNATLFMHAVGVHFTKADLTNASLTHANLTGAKISHEQLRRTRCLWQAKMSDGRIYDGRYNLKDDMALFFEHAQDPESAQELANFYGVSLAQFLEGQAQERTNQQIS